MENNPPIVRRCSLIPVEGGALKEEYDITRGVIAIDYYESIESPSISMTITFIDVDQVIGREGITGGEYIDVTVKPLDSDEFKITSKDHKMMLNSVRNMTTESNKQVATLEFVSVETIVNETARVNKRYTGNVTQIVKELLKDEKGVQTKKELDSDDATNSYTFVGNLKRPFDTIQWLCPKAQASKDSFGFLFYETREGYHFRSIESLLEQEPIPYQQSDRPIEGNKILQNNLNQTNDVGMNCRMGMYANKTIYVDIENQSTEVVDFKIKNLKLKKPPTLPSKLDESPTRLMLRVDDVGVSQVGSAKDDTVPKSELAKYQNKSYIRNNLLFSQSLSISIPLNINLMAGFLIEVKFPLKNEDGNSSTDKYGNEKTDDPSGRYLISQLRHLMAGGRAETQLTLIRDVFIPNKDELTDTKDLIKADNRHYGNTFPAFR